MRSAWLMVDGLVRAGKIALTGDAGGVAGRKVAESARSNVCSTVFPFSVQSRTYFSEVDLCGAKR
jgi:hypothetical protein